MEQKEEEAIDRVSRFPNIIIALKRYACRLKSTTIDGGMTQTNIKLRHDVPIKKIIKYAKDDLKV